LSIQVEILNEQEDEIGSTLIEMLTQLLQKGAEVEKVEEKEVVITLVDNEHIRQLNREFRNLDKPTDVLSFPLDEEDSLGDIIISIPRAKEQATQYGHSFERELGFLTIHGFLHLLGYDHHTEEEEKVMFGRQEQILSEFGLSR